MQDNLIALLNELGWTDIPAWGLLLVSSINIVAIVLLMLISKALVGRILSTFHSRLSARARGTEQRKRIDTLDRIFRYTTSVVITAIAIMVILGQLGISIAPFLATAGVVGIAVSFGAQSLVKDYFTGFVMLIENQIRQGDFITVAGLSGTVEGVTLRHVRLRDGEGTVHFVPNSSITTVSNFSRDFAYVVVDIGVGYQTNLAQAYDTIKTVGADLRSHPDTQGKTLADLEIMGVTQLADSSVQIRARMKVVALEQWAVKRLMLAKLKDAFEQAGIEIPFPQRVLHITRETIDPKTNH